MKKTIVLIIAVFAIGLFILPSALGLFTGMHTYTEKQDTNCIKCHPIEGEELIQSDYHWSVGKTDTIWGITTNDACMTCHNKGKVSSGNDTHAAVTINCILCHPHVQKELNNSQESHRKFYLSAIESDIQSNGNEACIACHTCVGFNYTSTPPKILTYDASTNIFGTSP